MASAPPSPPAGRLQGCAALRSGDSLRAHGALAWHVRRPSTRAPHADIPRLQRARAVNLSSRRSTRARWPVRCPIPGPGALEGCERRRGGISRPLISGVCTSTPRRSPPRRPGALLRLGAPTGARELFFERASCGCSRVLDGAGAMPERWSSRRYCNGYVLCMLCL